MFTFVEVQHVLVSVKFTGEQVHNCLPLCYKVRSTAVSVMCTFYF